MIPIELVGNKLILRGKYSIIFTYFMVIGLLVMFLVNVLSPHFVNSKISNYLHFRYNLNGFVNYLKSVISKHVPDLSHNNLYMF